MLLDEHCGENDQDTNRVHDTAIGTAPGHHIPCAAVDADHDHQRIEYMNAGTEVRWRIRMIQACDKAGEYVVSWHHRRAQILNVRPDQGDDYKQCHTDVEHGRALVIIIAVEQEQEPYAKYHIDEPREIRDDEYLTEWDHVIECHVDIGVLEACHILDPAKGRKIQENVGNHSKAGLPEIAHNLIGGALAANVI